MEKSDIARGYDAIAGIVGIADENFYNECADIHPKYEGIILDVGCGRGLLLKVLRTRAKPGTKFFGLDISPKLCELARQNNPDAEITCGDAEALPYPDSMFDTVFMTEALEHMLDFDAALSEIRRVLKPGGLFIVTVPNRDWASYDFYDKIRDHALQPVDDHYFRFAEITGHLTKNSFKILTYRGLDNLYYYGRIHRLELVAAFFLPFLHRKMKRLLFKCENQK